MTNHRKASLLTTLSEVVERFMYKRLIHHMHTDIILVPEQFGFRKDVSAEDAALKLTESVIKSVYKNHMLEEFSVI
jgi:hypothetical protein